MLRNVAIVAGGIVLAFALIVVMAIVEVNCTSAGAIAPPGGPSGVRSGGKDTGPNLETVLEEARQRRLYLYQPLIALAVGAFVSMLARTRSALLALLAVLPFGVLVARTGPDLAIGLARAAAYVGIAMATATLLHRLWKHKPRPHPSQQ
jgi:hypothetical protein